MDDRNLVRLGGAAAIAGGALRFVDAFLANDVSPQALAPVYFLTDVLLLGGILALYFRYRLMIGKAGVIAVALAFVGLLIVRSDNLRVFGYGGYSLGAPVALIGATLLGALIALRGRQRVAAALWLSALAIGIAAPCCESPAFSIFFAGILYGAGFVAAGVSLASESFGPGAPTQANA